MQLISNPNMPSDFKGNGCGPDGWKGGLIPDTLGGINISEACSIHDYDYSIGGNDDDRERYNLHFLCNMLMIIRRDDTWYTNEDIALKWAMQYYLAVEECGKEYFNYTY